MATSPFITTALKPVAPALAKLLGRDIIGMLGRDNDRIDAERLAVAIFHGDLRFSVRAKVIEFAAAADVCFAPRSGPSAI